MRVELLSQVCGLLDALHQYAMSQQPTVPADVRDRLSALRQFSGELVTDMLGVSIAIGQLEVHLGAADDPDRGDARQPDGSPAPAFWGAASLLAVRCAEALQPAFDARQFGQRPPASTTDESDDESAEHADRSARVVSLHNRHPELTVKQIASRLRAQGVPCRAIQVRSILAHYRSDKDVT